MLQFIAAIILSALVISPAWSKCPVEIPKMLLTLKHAKNFVMQENLEVLNKTTVVPYPIQGKTGCYTEEQHVDIKVAQVEDGKFVDFNISPLAVSIDNIPTPETFHYLNIDYDESSRPTKTQFMSVLCSGEIPITADAFSGTINKLLKTENSKPSEPGVFISTGESAGTNYSISRNKKEEAKVYDRFLDLYEEKALGENIESTNIFIPNILSGLTQENISGDHKKIMSWFFSTTLSSLNACSKKFVERMKDHQIENVIQNKPFKDISIKKQNRPVSYLVRWTL